MTCVIEPKVHYIKSLGEIKEIPWQDSVASLHHIVSRLYDDMPEYNYSLHNSKGQPLLVSDTESLLTMDIQLSFKFPLVYSIGDNPEKIISRGSVFRLYSSKDTDDGNYEFVEDGKFDDNTHLTIHQWGGYPYHGKFSFYNKCRKLTILAKDEPLLLNVTSMEKCFRSIEIEIGSSSKGLSNWDVSNVTNMSYIFSFSRFYGGSFDISRWDVSNVTNMRCMFWVLRFMDTSLDISKWNVSKVTDMSGMFNESIFKVKALSLSNWNVSNVTNMSGMFIKSKFNIESLGISGWDVSNVTNMSGMFRDSRIFKCKNYDISNWNVSKVTNMYGMFYNTEINGDIFKWNISKLISKDMFRK